MREFWNSVPGWTWHAKSLTPEALQASGFMFKGYLSLSWLQYKASETDA